MTTKLSTATLTAAAAAESTFRKAGGTLRTKEALAAGIHPRTLYALRDTGRIEQLARGLFRLADAEPSTDPDLLTVAARVPAGVLCLVSALQFHGLTTQIPRRIHIALPEGASTPRLSHPPLQVYRFRGPAMTEGVEQHPIDGRALRVFSPEKSLADCFKFRRRIGLDICLEALRAYLRRRQVDVAALQRYARVDRVARVMQPYLEAMQ